VSEPNEVIPVCGLHANGNLQPEGLPDHEITKAANRSDGR
jgi:hypothetical protein